MQDVVQKNTLEIITTLLHIQKGPLFLNTERKERLCDAEPRFLVLS